MRVRPPVDTGRGGSVLSRLRRACVLRAGRNEERESGMPTYEYECQKCGHLFEQFQRITAEPLKQCPQCKGKVKRLMGKGAGIIFKGSGFYQTDYRSESYKRGAKADTGSTPPASTAPASTPPASTPPAADSSKKEKKP